MASCRWSRAKQSKITAPTLYMSDFGVGCVPWWLEACLSGAVYGSVPPTPVVNPDLFPLSAVAASNSKSHNTALILPFAVECTNTFSGLT